MTHSGSIRKTLRKQHHRASSSEVEARALPLGELKNKRRAMARKYTGIGNEQV